MSFLSGSTGRMPKQKPRLAGLDDLRTATNENARPIPYVCGTQRVGVTFISQGLGFRSEATGGAKKGGPTSHNYYATFAAAICHGVIDSANEIWFDDEQVWVGPLTRVPGEDYVDITITDHGSVRLYWGTPTQSVDPVLATYSAIEDHPPYQGLAYLVFDDLLLGTNRATAPSVEVVVGRYPEAPGWMSAAVAIGSDVNPIVPIWELLTSPRFGLGIASSAINTTALNAMGTRLESEGFGLSVVLTKASTLRECLVELLEYVDGFHRVETDGKLALKLIRPVAEVDVLEVFAESDLVDDPHIEPGAWSTTASGVQVKFTNGTRYYKEDVIGADDAANLAITGEVKLPVVERPWVTSPDVASRMARLMAQRGGQPQGKVTMKVRRSRAVDKQPGDNVKLFWAHLGIEHLRCRVTAVDLPAAGDQAADIELEIDAALLNDLYAPVEPYAPPTVTIITPSAPIYAGAGQLPADLTVGSNPQVAGWVQAPTIAHDGWWFWHQLPDTSFEASGSGSTEFADVVRLDDDMPDVALTHDPTFVVRLTVQTPDTDLRRFSTGDIASGRVYLWLGPEFVRILSATLVGAGQYAVTVVRGCHGSPRFYGHAGDVVFAFNIEKLTRHSVTEPGDATHVFRIQPGVFGRRVSLASCGDIPVVVTRSSIGPTAPLNLRVDGEHASPRWVGSADLAVSWDPAEAPSLELFDRWAATPATGLPVVVDVLDGSMVVVMSVTTAGGAATTTLANADLVTALGSSTSFTLRVRHRNGAFLSPNPTSVYVTRI